jgi:hypothetical protein
MKDDLGVGAGGKDMATRDHFVAQLDVIEDFAVEGDVDRAVGIGHRLLAAFQIDDGKPRMGQPDIVGGKEALRVRPAMGDGTDHALQQRLPRH